MGSPTTAMGVPQIPAQSVAPVSQTALAPVAQQSGVVIPPDLLAQLLALRSTPSVAEDTGRKNSGVGRSNKGCQRNTFNDNRPTA
jgi:hypothetical protein